LEAWFKALAISCGSTLLTMSNEESAIETVYKQSNLGP
jgi:hypothetical protein